MVYLTYFVHGTTTDNEKDLATGWQPGELSEIGKKQAIELGKLVAKEKFEVVFCSDLKRAVDSAHLGFGGYKIIKDKRLRECNYGEFTGQPADKFKENLADYLEKPFPNGESYWDVERRIKDFLEFLKENFDNKKVALVSHQAPQLTLEVLLKNKTWQQAFAEDWRKTKSWKPGWKYVID